MIGLALPLPSNTITTSASGTNDIDVIAYNELSIASLTWVIMKQSVGYIAKLTQVGSNSRTIGEL